MQVVPVRDHRVLSPVRYKTLIFFLLIIQTNILITMQKLILASLLSAAAAFAPASQSGKAMSRSIFEARFAEISVANF